MAGAFPDMKSKIFGAMQRLPLDGWEPAMNIHDILNRKEGSGTSDHL